ncbi:MAG: hypothetical protein EWV50_17125 [Microcystis aeruginosa Ma_MB_F_20061100_S20]|uniref:Uncharacterized protein n=1 Tax=Microcystis aeruginosa Ma_MB_F_20061100_S20D TaxID=2486253 RepID=A0A552EHU1_MICAE|nr:MAG: hypothetical protein EWV78_14080 [Microcystis aeruginosa Ma_MB_F_20061100_S20D]TRU35368.1 MAG: hypothetical protein EWV50_17125 [Microcystis aeruginosa Ma_MB_F_20061100_S20]
MGIKNLHTSSLIGGLRGDRNPPYQGGIKGGSNLKSIFNLIITNYLAIESIYNDFWLNCN